MKKSTGVRSLAIVSVFALLLSSRAPLLGCYLELGVLFGIANMWLVMWSNERFIDGRLSRSRRSMETFGRLSVASALVALTFYRGPWWAISLTLLGFYTPYLLYAVELLRLNRTGK